MQITGPDMAAVTPDPAAAPTPRPALPPASTADPPAATQAAEAPAPDGLQLEIPAANITVVRTAAELQRAALAGVQDIEIRAHLDLRSLKRDANPAMRDENSLHSNRLALLYASPPLRSIRVCPPAASAISLLSFEVRLARPCLPEFCQVGTFRSSY